MDAVYRMRQVTLTGWKKKMVQSISKQTIFLSIRTSQWKFILLNRNFYYSATVMLQTRKPSDRICICANIRSKDHHRRQQSGKIADNIPSSSDNGCPATFSIRLDAAEEEDTVTNEGQTARMEMSRCSSSQHCPGCSQNTK